MPPEGSVSRKTSNHAGPFPPADSGQVLRYFGYAEDRQASEGRKLGELHIDAIFKCR